MQTEILIPSEYKELFNPKWRNILYYGGRASGKSHSVARALLLRARKDKKRVLCTREIQKSIKDSVHKLLADLIATYEFDDYTVQNDIIINKVTGSEFIFRGIRNNTTEIKSTEGIDLCWVEEAHATSNESWNIITPTVRKSGSQIIATFNRMTELDPVYVKFILNAPPNTYGKKVNYDVMQKLGWLDETILQEIEYDRSNPELFAHKWLGEPIGQAEFSVLAREAVLEAMQRTVDDTGEIEVGVDVARMGNDRTVFWKVKGLKTQGHKVMHKLRVPEVCDQLEQFVDYNKSIFIKVDDTGVGGGVTDEMDRRGYNVVGINFGGRASDPDKYSNWISEAWFHMQEIMPKIELPYDSDLLMELTTRQWKQDIRGRRAIEGKDTYKKRGFRSPDIADACIIAYAKPTKYIDVDSFML